LEELKRDEALKLSTLQRRQQEFLRRKPPVTGGFFV
jgi:hypothetical protein